MLRCNKYLCHPQGEIMTIDFESLKERLQEMFPKQQKSDVEKYIESKNPENTVELEYWIQQWNYSNKKYSGL
jgi:hypothetical protein